MMSKKQHVRDEIDLGALLVQLWREKILILSISLAFVVLGYLYGSTKPKIYKTEIITRDAYLFLFQGEDILLTINEEPPLKQKQIIDEFNNEFKINLLSLDTLVLFVEQNNEIDDFKYYLKVNNIDVRNYFVGKIKKEPEARNPKISRYSLTFQKPLPGENFLNNYIMFVKKKTETDIKEKILQDNVHTINIYKQNLEIAEKIGLEGPIPRKNMGDNGPMSNRYNEELFYQGTKILSEKIAYQNKILKENKDKIINYNPILDKASKANLISKSPTIYGAIAFILGLLFSCIIIFIKKIVKQSLV